MLNRTISTRPPLAGFLRSLRTTLLAATLFAPALATHAAVVFDTLTGSTRADAQTFAPSVYDPGPPVLFSESIREVGDLITLAGTERVLSSFTVGLVNYGFASALDFDLTLNLYANNAQQTLLASQTLNVSRGVFGGPYAFDVAFFTATPLLLPDSFFYGVAFDGATAPGVGLGLFDYVDEAPQILVGTDPGNTGSLQDGSFVTRVYGRRGDDPLLTLNTGTNNLALLSDGYTPTVRIVAVSPIPEPQTQALMLLGLAAVGGLSGWRRRTGRGGVSPSNPC